MPYTYKLKKNIPTRKNCVRKLRKWKGYSQLEAATLSKLPFATYKRIEDNLKKMSDFEEFSLTVLFNVSVNQLYESEEQ